MTVNFEYLFIFEFTSIFASQLNDIPHANELLNGGLFCRYWSSQNIHFT